MNQLEKLKTIRTKSELADILKINPSFLTHSLYIDKPQYKTFKIPKKSGGTRIIQAPESNIKSIQSRLSDLLLDCVDEINKEKYSDTDKKSSTLSHGFVRNKSIATNAIMHRNQKNVLNIDLEDFFGSFNFGRVRGFFIKNRHFELDEHIATVIAQIACYENALPQGSPCSPVITNLIAHTLDIRLVKLARKHGYTYSRYADDLTFSTRKKEFSREFVMINEDSIRIGKKLKQEIIRAGFSVNHKKTRVQYRQSRQDVTGLIVNKKVNVKSEYWRLVRAKCHALFMDGKFVVHTEDGEIEENINKLEGQLNFIDSIDKFNHNPLKGKPPKDIRYQSFNDKYHFNHLNVREKTLSKFLFYKYFYGNQQPTILTEGKTDPIYLKSAIHQLAESYPKLASPKTKTQPYKLLVNFLKYSARTRFLLGLDGGGNHLKEFVRLYETHYKRYKAPTPSNPVILVLDNDTGPTSLLNYLSSIHKGKRSYPQKTEDMRKTDFMHITENLYVVLTPLKKDGSATEMEDFFTKETLNRKLNGKNFIRKDSKTETHYGKHIFATKVVQTQKKTISFNKFKLILNRIVTVINDYDKVTIKQ